MFCLYRLLGISAIIGSAVCIVTMIPLQFLIGKKMSENANNTAVSCDCVVDVSHQWNAYYKFHSADLLR